MICHYSDNKVVTFVMDDVTGYDVVFSHALFNMGFGGVPRYSALLVVAANLFGADRLYDIAKRRYRDEFAGGRDAIHDFIEGAEKHVPPLEGWNVYYDGSTISIETDVKTGLLLMGDITRLSDLADALGEKYTVEWTGNTYTSFIHAVPKEDILSTLIEMSKDRKQPVNLEFLSRAIDADRENHPKGPVH